MDTDTPAPAAQTLDLTGLPDVVVAEVMRIVTNARVRLARGLSPFPDPMFISDPDPSPEEAIRMHREMAKLSSGQALPADWSRADIYDDHD